MLLIGICILSGCIKNDEKECRVNLVRSLLTFAYPDVQGIDRIEEEGRIAHIDYYLFDSQGRLHANYRVSREEGYKSVPVNLPEGEITVVAWANLSESDVLPADPELPLDEWKLALAKSGEKHDVHSGTLYHATHVLPVSKKGGKEFTIYLKHRHANIAVRLEGSGIEAGALYECELMTGENTYGFKHGMKLGTGKSGYTWGTFKVLDRAKGTVLGTLLRTYRLFEETDNHATIQLYKDGVKIGEAKKLEELVQEAMQTQQIYAMHEQNISLGARIDKQGNVSFSVSLSLDWNEGTGGFIPF